MIRKSLIVLVAATSMLSSCAANNEKSTAIQDAYDAKEVNPNILVVVGGMIVVALIAKSSVDNSANDIVGDIIDSM